MELLVVELIAENDSRMDTLCRNLNHPGTSAGSAADAGGERLWTWMSAGSGHSLVCRAKMPEFRLAEHGGRMYAEAAAILADYIVEHYETYLIQTIIKKQFHYTAEDEVSSIEACCRLVLSGEQWQGEEAVSIALKHDSFSRRSARIAQELERFMQENTHLHLQGFITFRLHEYWQELREAVEYAVEEYVMDKQYQEFISLLKYFVDVQPARRELVHVIQEEQQHIRLLDHHFSLLDTRAEDRALAELVDSELNVEDMVLSTLITASPASICIHAANPDHQVVRTIKAIFDSRVTLCAGCRECGHGALEALGGGES